MALTTKTTTLEKRIMSTIAHDTTMDSFKKRVRRNVFDLEVCLLQSTEKKCREENFKSFCLFHTGVNAC